MHSLALLHQQVCLKENREKLSARSKHPGIEITAFLGSANCLDTPKEKDMWLNKIKKQS